jgi:hypothetical protein
MTCRPSPRVIYVGRADRASESVPCSSCGADIGCPCIPNRHTGPVPHAIRIELAAAIGLRDVAVVPLFDDGATRALR